MSATNFHAKQYFQKNSIRKSSMENYFVEKSTWKSTFYCGFKFYG